MAEELTQIRNTFSFENSKLMHVGKQKATFSKALFLNDRYLVGALSNWVAVADTHNPEKKLIFSHQVAELIDITPLDRDSFALTEKNRVHCVTLIDGKCTVTCFDYLTDTIRAVCALNTDYLILVGEKGTVIVDRNGELIHTLPKEAAQQNSIITVNKGHIDAWSADNSLQSWSSSKPYNSVQNRLPNDNKRVVKNILRLDDRRIMVSYTNSPVLVWSCETGKVITKLEPEYDNDTALCFTAFTEKQIAIGYKSGLVLNWDISNPKPTNQIIAFKADKPVINLSYAQGTLTIIFEDGEVRNLFMNEYASFRDLLKKV